MADNPWTSRAVLELDIAAAAVFVETPERTPRLGGRWLVYDAEVWWELPDGAGYQRSVYTPAAFPGVDFMSAGVAAAVPR